MVELSAILLIFQNIQRTPQLVRISLHHMGVDFRGFDVGMPHQLLNNPYVYAILQQMGGKTVTKGMGGGRLVHTGFCQGFFKYFLHSTAVGMVATVDLVFTVVHQAFRNENVLPGKFGSGAGILSYRCVGQHACVAPDLKVFGMGFPDELDLPV